MINYSDIHVDLHEYSYFKELSGVDKIQYLIEIYDLEIKKQNIDPIQLANGLNEFFDHIDEPEEELEFDSYHLQGKERVDVMIDTDNILIESNSLKAVRHIKYKCIDSGYILKRDKETEKIFKKNKVGRYLRIYNIIGTENHLCYS
tara:strand:+ start:871 stop:1308 length:438 start_codon:yes stop_codon:yes gene_type:complete